MKLLLAILLLAAPAAAQFTTTARHIAPVTSLPATCKVATGDVVYLTTGTKGVYECGPTDNNWAILTGGTSGNTTTSSGTAARAGVACTDVTLRYVKTDDTPRSYWACDGTVWKQDLVTDPTTNGSITLTTPATGLGLTMGVTGSIPANATLLFPNAVGTQGQVMALPTPIGSSPYQLAWATPGGGAAITQGTFAALPATCTTNDLYYFTDSLYTVARCSATNTWSYFHNGRSVTPPTGVWSWDNQNSATIDTSRGFHILTNPTGDSTHAVRYQTAPTPPYTRTFAVISNPFLVLNYSEYMIGFRDAGGKLTGFRWSYNAGGGTPYVASVTTFSSATTPVTNLYAATFTMIPNPFYVKIGDDNTNITFDVSVDGYTFYRTWTALRSSYLTSPAQIFFSTNGNSGLIGATLDVISIQ